MSGPGVDDVSGVSPDLITRASGLPSERRAEARLSVKRDGQERTGLPHAATACLPP
jgi:hypothetical protein